MKQKVAVILINYNGIQDTEECINSLKNSRCRYQIDILIIDNASENNEGEKLKKIFGDAIVIQSETNCGFAGGNNIGIKYAMEHGYDFVMLLNNDTIVETDTIDILLDYTDDRSVCSPHIFYYGQRKETWFGGGNINRFTGNAYNHVYESKNTRFDNWEESISCTFITGCCILMKTSIFKKVGLLAENYFMYCEDTEFCLRLLSNGIEIKYIPGARLFHKASKSTGGCASPLSSYYTTRNRLMCINDHPEFFFKTAYLFSIISRYLRVFQYLLQGKQQWRAILRGIQDYKKGILGKGDF